MKPRRASKTDVVDATLATKMKMTLNDKDDEERRMMMMIARRADPRFAPPPPNDKHSSQILLLQTTTDWLAQMPAKHCLNDFVQQLVVEY